MIYSLNGFLVDISPAQCVIDCGGVGYVSNISLKTYQDVKKQDPKQIFLYTTMVVREDAQLLYGFSSKKERELFGLLVSVNGVGPSSAMMILSTLEQDLILKSIGSDDAATIQTVKGIGAKTAQRIIIDLKDKINIDEHILSVETIGKNSFKKDALTALEVLGTSKNNAEKVIDKLLSTQDFQTVQELVKAALKSI